MKQFSRGAFMLLILVPLISSAQSGGIVFQHELKGDIPGASVYIVNGGAQTVGFLLSLNRKTWERFSLNSSEGRLAYASQGDIQKMFIRVSTGKRHTDYTLNAGNRYQLYWSNSKKSWDVTKISARE